MRRVQRSGWRVVESSLPTQSADEDDGSTDDYSHMETTTMTAAK